MDDLDHKLIALLRTDSRTTAAALAKALKVSRGTVQNRIDRLMNAGILLGFTIRLGGPEAGAEVRAITSIEIEGGGSVQVMRALRGMPAVTKIHTTNGRWDMVAELTAADLTEFSNTLDEIRGIQGIVATETSLLLKTIEF